MKRKILLVLAISLSSAALYAQTGNVGIGTTTPHANALLELNSNSKGLLTPRLTTAQRDAITPKPEGLVIYNLDDHCLQYWNGTQWNGNCSGSITPSVVTLNCAGASIAPGTITSGSAYTGTLTVPYTGGNGGSYSAGSPIASTGVTGLTATLQAGTLTNGAGNLTYAVSGTPGSAGTATFPISFNGATACNASVTVNAPTPPPTPDLTTTCTGALLPATTQGNSATITVNSLPVTATFSAYTNIQHSGSNGGPFCNVTTLAGYQYTLGIGTNNPSSMQINFNRDVSNIKVYVTDAQNTESFTFTCKSGGVAVTPTFTVSSSGTCNGNFSIIPGTTTTVNVSGSGVSGLIVNIGSVWFDEIVITHNGLVTGSRFNYCVGAAQ